MAYAGYMPGPERRRMIVEGAKRVFASRGYRDTHVSHICEDLGIGRGTLYQYFENKRDVFAAIVEDLLERLRELVSTRPAVAPVRGVTAEQAIDAAAYRLREVLAVVFRDEACLRILLREAAGVDVHVDSILAAIDAVVVGEVTRDIELAQGAGLFRTDVDPRTAALLVIGGVQKLALAALTRSEPVDLEAFARTVTRLQLLGLLERGGLKGTGKR